MPKPDPGPLAALDVDRLRPMLHRYCARMVGSALDGEDLAQEAWMRALQAAPSERPIENPGGWLFRIAHNLALDHLRRRARRPPHESDDDLALVIDPTDHGGRRDAAEASLPAFMAMPALQRSVVILADVLEYSAEEIAEILSSTVAAVKSALQRGRSRLRTHGRQQLAGTQPTALSAPERQLLQHYGALFNARDFDALRALLAADVQLDLVNRLQLQGAAVSTYFSRYGETLGWRAWAGVAEGRPALLMQQVARDDEQADYVVVLGWSGARVTTIRDFLFARYAMQDMDHAALESR